MYVEDGVVTGEGSSTTWAQVRDLMGQAVDDTAAARRARARDDGRPAGRDSTKQGRPGLVDRELLGAGIHPGHPSLYQPPEAAETGRPWRATWRPRRPRRPTRSAPAMSPAIVALALGLPMAAVAAVRATWSP